MVLCRLNGLEAVTDAGAKTSRCTTVCVSEEVQVNLQRLINYNQPSDMLVLFIFP